MQIEEKSKEQMMDEAVKRMIILGINDEDISFYQDTELVPLFINEASIGPHIHTDKSLDDDIIAFQEKYDAEVYCVIIALDGQCAKKHLLFVSPFDDLWMLEKLAVQKRKLVVFSLNLTKPELSRFEEIIIAKRKDGTLIRIG